MQISQIKPNSIIDIKVSTYFYRQLQELALYIHSQFEDEEYTESLSKVGNDEELNEKEYALRTILALSGEIENQAEKQGYIEMVDLP